MLSSTAVIVVLIAVHTCSDESNNVQMYIPAVNPYNVKLMIFRIVSSQYLVQDPYRNPHIKATILTMSDFISFPNIHPNSHFIPIANTGYGMTLFGSSAREINREIEKIVRQLPNKSMKVTYYQRKDEKRFPYHNVYTGPYKLTHLPPHQHYYRPVWNRSYRWHGRTHYYILLVFYIIIFFYYFLFIFWFRITYTKI